jgi:hypothetical protein
MIGTAASLTAKEKVIYPRMVNGVYKTAAQLTKEDNALWGNIGRAFNLTGGTIGSAVNTFKAASEYNSGESGWSLFHGSLAAGYAIGITLTIVCPECGYGEYLLISTMAADIAGEELK